MFKTKASLWHPQFMYIAWHAWFRIDLWTPLCPLDIEFPPSRQQNHVFSMSMSFSQSNFSMTHITVLESVEGTSTRNMKFILNSLFFSQIELRKILHISFLAALDGLPANSTMSADNSNPSLVCSQKYLTERLIKELKVHMTYMMRY